MVRKNMYVIIDPTTGAPIADKYELSSKVSATSYIGWHTALEFHGVAHQPFYNAYVGSQSRFKEFSFKGIDFKYCSTPFEPSETNGVIHPIGNPYVRVTDLERTVIDCCNRIERAGGVEELLHCLESVSLLNESKLKKYLCLYNKAILYQKVGFILERSQKFHHVSSKFIDAHEAARWVASGDTVCTVGMTLIGAAESILSAIEARFLTAGEPRDLTLLHAAGQSDRQRGIQHFAHPGMVTRLIGSHWGLAPRWMAMINNNEVEAWCLPQGQIVHLYSAMAAGLPGRLSPVGLGTFVDPRIEGGRMNARTRERPNLIEHVTFRGDEYLFYPALPLDVVIVRGTHADEDGNLTTDEEVMKLEVLHAVLAARRYGAKVLAQVKYRVAKGSLHPKSITVPGNLIDAIVVCEEPQTDHRQTSSWAFDPALCGDIQLPAAQNAPLPLDLRKLIGRIACRYLTPGCVINLGTGIPNDVIGAIIHEEQLGEQVTITVESGIYGGQQAGGVDFGIGRNLSAMISHQDQMLYYNGAGVDITFMGAGEMDPHGHVNATRLGASCPGAGGFIDITQNARHVVFCSSFTAKGLEIACEHGALHIRREGEVRKFVAGVNQISYNGELARAKGQTMHYVTERAVFELRPEGPVLTEIAPGIDLERDILAHMDFHPAIAADLQVMDSRLFAPPPCGLAEHLSRNSSSDS